MLKKKYNFTSHYDVVKYLVKQMEENNIEYEFVHEQGWTIIYFLNRAFVWNDKDFDGIDYWKTDDERHYESGGGYYNLKEINEYAMEEIFLSEM